MDGYKRHVLYDLDTGLIRVVGIIPANIPEASVTKAISEDLEQQEVYLKELHIDRAYLSSHEGSVNAATIWKCIAKPGRFATANAFPSKLLPWIGKNNLSAVRLRRKCPLYPVGSSIFPKTLAPSVPCKPNARPVPEGEV